MNDIDMANNNKLNQQQKDEVVRLYKAKWNAPDIVGKTGYPYHLVVDLKPRSLRKRQVLRVN